MDDVLAQARAQWSAAAGECRTGLAAAESQLAAAQAAASANAAEIRRSTELASASLTARPKNPDGGIMIDGNSAYVPPPLPERRRPARADYDEDEGPTITREDSW